MHDEMMFDNSPLARWQKIDATNIFILPQLSFILRGTHVQKKCINQLVKLIRKKIKKWLNQSQRVTNPKGGTGILPIHQIIDLATITQGWKMLHCEGPLVASIAQHQLKDTIRRRL